MLEKETAIMNRLSSDRADLVGNCRFFNNEFVVNNDFIREAAGRCSNAVEGLHVLAVSDTSEINYRKHSGKLSKEDKKLGPVGNNTDIGFFIHPTFVLDAKDAFPLGLSNVYIWNRRWDKDPNENKKNSSIPIQDKESYKWIESCLKSKKVLTKAAMVTFIADRESDIFEEFAIVPGVNVNLLIRSMHDRKLYDIKDTLYSYVSSLEIAGKYELEIKKSQHKRQPRTALMEVRYGKVRIAKPSYLNGYAEYIELHVVEAKEHASTVPLGEEQVRWCLLTTHKVDTLLDAVQMIFWYSLRWNIEQLFRTLKSKGLDVESSQIEDGAALQKLVLMALSSAVIIMQLVIGRDGKVERPGTIIFNKNALEFLKILLKTYEGKTEKQKNPFKQCSLAWVAWIIARIGGWKGYQRASPPGPITMKRGLEIFFNMFQGWLIREMCSHGSAPDNDLGDVCIE